MAEIELQGFAGIGALRAKVFKEQLGLTDPKELAGHWSFATPQGRALLRWAFSTPEGWEWLGLDPSSVEESDRDTLRVGECDILRWAFAFELMRLDISAGEAVSLVDQGITLRDIKSKTARELARLGWPFIDEETFERWQRELEEEEGRAPFTVDFYDLLVVSDFHLAAGDDPSPEGITRLSPTEDFHFDDAFFRFLFYCEKERQKRGGYPYELVFNGDMVDFAQIVVPEKERGLKAWSWLQPAVISRHGTGRNGESFAERLHEIVEKVYGSDAYGEALETWGRWAGEERADWTDEEWTEEGEEWGWAEQANERWRNRVEQERAAWRAGPQEVHAMKRKEALNQLADACQGHRRFFWGLAWFLAQGNRLVLIRGNHDLQWYWPEVQLAFVGWLKAAYDELRATCKTSARHELPVPLEEVKELEKDLPPMTLEDFEARVNFDTSWYYHRERLAYIAHGGQQEFLNSIRYFLRPVVGTGQEATEDPGGGRPDFSVIAARKDPPRTLDWLPALRVSDEEEEIEPPVGSLGLVYFVNNLEIEFPNFQRPEYKEVYRKALLYRNPLLLLRLLKAVGRFLKAWVNWTRRQLSRRRQEQYAARLEAYARLTGMPVDGVKQLDETRWVEKWRKPGYGVGVFAFDVLLRVLPLLLIVLGIMAIIALVIHAIYGLRSALDPGFIPPDRGSIIDILFSIATSSLVSGAILYWLWALARSYLGLGEDKLFKPSQRVAHILKGYGKDVPYILFGHDHDHNAQPLKVDKWCSNSECVTELRKRGFLPGKWPHKILPWKWRRHIRLEEAQVKVRCSSCSAEGSSCLNLSRLAREVKENLEHRQGPSWYILANCPLCGYENARVTRAEDADPSMEKVESCSHCGGDLWERDVRLTSLPQAPLNAFSFSPDLNCKKCKNRLRDGDVQVLPPHVLFACPRCNETEQQWLGVWSLNCPECGQRTRKQDIHLIEDRAVVHCPCGRHYPGFPPPGRWYLNTGTWLHWFDKGRKRLLRRDLEYAFVRMIDTHRVLAARADDYMQPTGPWGEETRPKVQLLRWNDAARRVEPCETFKGMAED